MDGINYGCSITGSYTAIRSKLEMEKMDSNIIRIVALTGMNIQKKQRKMTNDVLRLLVKGTFLPAKNCMKLPTLLLQLIKICLWLLFTMRFKPKKTFTKKIGHEIAIK